MSVARRHWTLLHTWITEVAKQDTKHVCEKSTLELKGITHTLYQFSLLFLNNKEMKGCMENLLCCQGGPCLLHVVYTTENTTTTKTANEFLPPTPVLNVMSCPDARTCTIQTYWSCQDIWYTCSPLPAVLCLSPGEFKSLSKQNSQGNSNRHLSSTPKGSTFYWLQNVYPFTQLSTPKSLEAAGTQENMNISLNCIT